MLFWNSLAFLMIQQMLAIWSLVPLPFLNPVWTSGSSLFTYCWSLTWRILSIILLACEMSAIVYEHSLALQHQWPLSFSASDPGEDVRLTPWRKAWACLAPGGCLFWPVSAGLTLKVVWRVHVWQHWEHSGSRVTTAGEASWRQAWKTPCPTWNSQQ